MGAPESDLDRLFSLPLAEFVAERKRIARALAQAGQRDDARAIDKIPRPSVSAWAVNQVARREPALVRRLAELTERLRGAQGRPGDDFGAMTAEHRQTLSSLRDVVDRVLGEGGHDAGPQLVRRVITNLRAGVADADTRPLVETGRLVRDVGEADFTTLFEALPPSTSPVSPPPKHRPKSDDTEAARHKEADRAARAAERERDKARASAERRLLRLREDAAKARDRLADEERAVAAARAALEAKEAHLARTRASSEEADATVAEVEAELARLEKT